MDNLWIFICTITEIFTDDQPTILSRKASLFCISLAQFFELDTETLALILRAEAWRRNPQGLKVVLEFYGIL